MRREEKHTTSRLLSHTGVKVIAWTGAAAPTAYLLHREEIAEETDGWGVKMACRRRQAYRENCALRKLGSTKFAWKKMIPRRVPNYPPGWPGRGCQVPRCAALPTAGTKYNTTPAHDPPFLSIPLHMSDTPPPRRWKTLEHSDDCLGQVGSAGPWTLKLRALPCDICE